jgi:hypothetical protein
MLCGKRQHQKKRGASRRPFSRESRLRDQPFEALARRERRPFDWSEPPVPAVALEPAPLVLDAAELPAPVELAAPVLEPMLLPPLVDDAPVLFGSTAPI